MFQKPDNFFFQPRHNQFRNEDFDDELTDLFNKKFQFSYNNNWKLPEKELWFSTPPWKLKQLESLKYRLNFHKSQLNDFNIEEWSNHTRRRNPAGEVGWKLRSLVNPEFLTQAWTKFYECASTYNIIPKQAITENMMVSLHLCEAPGAFITSLNHYLQQNHQGINWKWVANTLNPYYEGNSPSNMISDDRFMFHTLDNWDFGVDNTGNLMDWENSQAIIAKAQSLGKVLLVTADGSIDCLQKPEDQEEVTSPLHYCEIITALKVLSPGGSLVVKLFTMFEHSTVCLLYLVNNMFAEVNIYKPVTSKQGNSEVYAVCINYKGKASLETFLPVLKSTYGTELYGNVALFPLEAIPEDFLKQLQDCAYYFCSVQCHVIDNNLQAHILQNNINIHRDIKRIRAKVAIEFIWQYNLKPLEYGQEILKGILHEENKVNMNPRHHRGSHTERQLYTKMSLRDKLYNLNSFLQAEEVNNPLILIHDKVKWFSFYDDSKELKLVFTYGRPLKKINSSKFIFVPIFKLYNQILAEEKFKEILFNPERQDKIDLDNLIANKIKITKVVELQDFDLKINYNLHEKRCFAKVLDVLRELSIGQTVLIQNFHMLTHFNASLFYIMAKTCFEKIGFTPDYSLILENFKNKNALKYLNIVKEECDRVRSEEVVDVLNSLTVQTTNVGDFYNNVVLYNNTFYRNKCKEYLAKIEKYITNT